MHTIPHDPSTRRGHRTSYRDATTAVCLVVMLALAPACGGGGGGDGDGNADGSAIASIPSTGAEDTTSPAGSVEGTHRYAVVHENLGTCTGAADDGDESLTITLTPNGLILANLDFDWTQEFEQVAADRYTRSEVSVDGVEWRKQLTFTADGFVLESETDDPAQVGEGGGLQPCFRYTYTALD